MQRHGGGWGEGGQGDVYWMSSGIMNLLAAGKHLLKKRVES